MRARLLAVALIALAAPCARAQPAPAPPLSELQKGLFGEREPEPGDEAAAAGQAEPDALEAPEAPPAPSPSTEGYDTRVRQSFAAAESFQGPLDGGWTLSARREGPLYAIRFSDNHGRLEAAWRDLRRSKGALDSSGFVQGVERDGGRLTLRFSPADGVRDVATLAAQADGRWTGELDENGRKRAVTLRKTSP
jgi:hypothetical protein